MTKRFSRWLCLAVIGGLCLPGAAEAQVKVDPKLPGVQGGRRRVGELKSIGSDTMNNEMTLWAEGFLKFYPNVQAEIEGKGSTTGPPALISGTAKFAPMSRKMKAKEIDDFKKQFGYEPTALPTSIDMLAVYVHKDNPIKGLTMQQVDAIFSRTRKGGYPTDIKTWGDLGLGGEWKDRPIALYGRNAASGTYGYFKEKALFDGDYQERGQGTTRKFFGRARGCQRQIRHRLQRHWLQNGGRASRSRWRANAKSEMVPPEAAPGVQGRISAGPVAVRLRELRSQRRNSIRCAGSLSATSTARKDSWTWSKPAIFQSAKFWQSKASSR